MGKRNKQSLTITHPELAKEWHPIKNGTLTPRGFTFGSGEKVWWQCLRGHEWKAMINNRTSQETDCPYCTGKKVLIGFNDLATTHSHFVKEWHPVKNGTLSPQTVSAGNNRKVFWQCKEGHEWEAAIYKHVIGTNCPYCANKKVGVGFNDLATLNPELARQWHPTKTVI